MVIWTRIISNQNLFPQNKRKGLYVNPADLVRMPLCLAVVTEASLAPLPATGDPRAGRTASGHHGETAVGGWAPPGWGVGGGQGGRTRKRSSVRGCCSQEQDVRI